MFRKVVISLWLISCLIFTISAQEDTSELSYAEQLLALEQELDSMSIFNLLDSVLLLVDPVKSELGVRFGFTSSVTSAGRDYNINQSGLSPGISYFHKSGLYTDLSGYWNSGVTPNYNPTILSAGYIGGLSTKWSYSFDYERWFYNPQDSSTNLLSNSIASSINYDFKVGFASLDYAYLFGNGSSNRIIASITGNLDLGKWWYFKSVTVLPSASLMIGNGDITTLRITTQQLSEENKRRIGRIDSFSELTEEQVERLLLLAEGALNRGRITQEEYDQILNFLSLSQTLNPEQIDQLNQLAREGLQQETLVDSNAFGVLNYSISFPLLLSTDRLSILLSYTYSIPVKLPGEEFDVDPIGYFAASISYRIPFK